jgi:hypothetical protein
MEERQGLIILRMPVFNATATKVLTIDHLIHIPAQTYASLILAYSTGTSTSPLTLTGLLLHGPQRGAQLPDCFTSTTLHARNNVLT